MSNILPYSEARSIQLGGSKCGEQCFTPCNCVCGYFSSTASNDPTQHQNKGVAAQTVEKANN
jgi:hypothetical protein